MIAVVCLGGWSTLLDFQFLKKVDNLDIPDQLLYWFEKKHRYNLISWIVSYLLFIGIILVNPGSDFWTYLGVAIGIVIVVIIFYNCGGTWWYRKEKEIIEQLRELVEKK